VEQDVAWFDQGGAECLTAAVRVESSGSRGEYRSCRFIEGGASFHYNSVHLCSVPHHDRGQPFVAHFDGTRFPLEELLALREKVRAENTREEGHAACRGCAMLEKKQWPGRKYLFDYLGLGNWLYCNIECDYCELQTKGLAKRAKTFRPYGVKETIERFIAEELLAPYAVIDWGGGGEPTFYREFREVLGMLLDYGTFNYIHTNGTRSPETLRISAPERAHVICSLDAGLRDTYVRIKNRDYLERVWQNLEAYRRLKVKVTVKYIMKQENCGWADLEAFAERAARLRPVSALLDIDFNHPRPEREVVDALIRLTHLLRDARVPVQFGYTGDRFTPEMEVLKRVQEAVRSEGVVPQGMQRGRPETRGCECGVRETLVQIGIARAA
jgi:pyruvate-formate lyase-activating enzyme